MPTITDLLRAKMKGRAWEISQETKTEYRVAREFLLGTRDPQASNLDKWCAYLGLTLTENNPKPKLKKGQRRAKPGNRKRDKPK